jgi:hypothetical protein
MNARPLAWLLALLALAPAARAEEPGTWFHGDLHAHVSPPDLPREVWASFDRTRRQAVREGLDFVVLSPHLWHSGRGGREAGDAARIAAWLREGADFGAKDGGPLFIPGYEDTRGIPGHLGVDFLPRDAADLIAATPPRLALGLADRGALVFVNHPLGLPPGLAGFLGEGNVGWKPFVAPEMLAGRADAADEAQEILARCTGFEVFNRSIALAERALGMAREETHLDRAFRLLDREILRQRRRMVGFGGSDNHSIVLAGTTWVRAAALTPEALREAIRAGRVVVGGKAACALEVTTDLAPAGGGVGANLAAARWVELRFPGAALVWKDGEPLGERRGPWRDEAVAPGELHVYRIAIGDSYSNAVYVNLPEGAAGAPAEGLR